jgi:hypothetical protein
MTSVRITVFSPRFELKVNIQTVYNETSWVGAVIKIDKCGFPGVKILLHTTGVQIRLLQRSPLGRTNGAHVQGY